MKGLSGPVPWGLRELVFFICAYLLILSLCSFLKGIFHLGDTSFILVFILFGNVFLCLFILSILGKMAPDALKRTGIHGKGAWRAAGLGGSAYFSFFPAYMALVFLYWLLFELLGSPLKIQQAVRIFQEEPSLAGRIGLGFCYILVASVTEEFFFRGVIYPVLRKTLGVPLGIIAVSVFFALVHGLQASVPILFLGILLAFLFEVTGSLIAPITAHMLHNGLVLVLIP